jgi:HSP20 family protein
MKEVTAMQTVEKGTPIKLSMMDDFFDRVRATYDRVALRAYEIFESNGKQPGHGLEDWLKAESELLRPVHLEMVDSGKALVVRGEVPGFKDDEIEVNVEPRRLTITGQRERKDESQKGKTVYTEIHSDQILRVVELPIVVDSEKTTATLKNGVLELEMPKIVAPKNIKVEQTAA